MDKVKNHFRYDKDSISLYSKLVDFLKECWGILIPFLLVPLLMILIIRLIFNTKFDSVFFSNELYKFCLTIIGYTFMGILTNFVISRAQKRNELVDLLVDFKLQIAEIHRLSGEFIEYSNDQLLNENPSNKLGHEIIEDINNNLGILISLINKNTRVVLGTKYQTTFQKTKQVIQSAKTEYEKIKGISVLDDEVKEFVNNIDSKLIELIQE